MRMFSLLCYQRFCGVGLMFLEICHPFATVNFIWVASHLQRFQINPLRSVPFRLCGERRYSLWLQCFCARAAVELPSRWHLPQSALWRGYGAGCDNQN